MKKTIIIWEHQTFDITRLIIKLYSHAYGKQNIFTNILLVTSSKKKTLEKDFKRISELTNQYGIRFDAIYDFNGNSILDKAEVTLNNDVVNSSDIVLFCPGDNYLFYSLEDIKRLQNMGLEYISPQGVRCHLDGENLKVYETNINDNESNTSNILESIEQCGLGNNASVFWGLFKQDHFIKRMRVLYFLQKNIKCDQSIISDSLIGIICGISNSQVGNTSFEYRMADISEDSSLAKKSIVQINKKSRYTVLNELATNNPEILRQILDKMIDEFVNKDCMITRDLLRKAMQLALRNYAISGIMGSGRIRRSSYTLICNSKINEAFFRVLIEDKSFCNLYANPNLGLSKEIIRRLPKGTAYSERKFWTGLKLVNNILVPRIREWYDSQND